MVLFPVVGCTGPAVTPPEHATTVILLRHAERDVLAEDLNEAGRTRAAALPAALSGVGIDAIYSPPMSRNRDTVAPLARDRGLDVKVIDVDRVAWRLVDDNPGKTVMWVGNTTNLPQIYEDLGGDGEPPVRYGDLYFVRLSPGGDVAVTRTRFGR
jgi:hypothetical protein